MTSDPQRWAEVRAIFEEAAPKSGAERARFLDAACGSDRELRAEVERLLAYDAAGGDTVDRVIAETAAEVGSPSLHGRLLGPYRILRELGQGGMGSVWLAERADGTFDKEVAIKLVRGLPSRPLVERFAAERRILAALDHPNIARLLDAGATEDGSPYVVMEHVDGAPIDRYCEENGLGRRARLGLFLKVCAAVEHAHRALVVHRDIKPGNILVDRSGKPTLLDFGIAKLLDDGSTPGPGVRTGTATRLLTLDYASPEQVRGETITTATDVYSLGVLLYTLLAGRLPYRVDASRPGELERAICEAEPERLGPGAASEIENVVQMALRKEPERRYSSVAQFADDVRRFLDGRPVSARPATWRYRTAKFVSRHRVGVVTTALVALVIVGSSGYYTYRLAEEREVASRERDVAAKEREAAEEVTSFLVDLFGVAAPEKAKGRTITAEEILHDGATRIRDELTDQPILRARLLYTIAEVYERMGLYREAEELARESFDLREKLLPENDPAIVDGLNLVAELRYRAGDYRGAREIVERLVAVQENALGPRDRRVGMLLNNLAILDQRLGDFAGARDRYRRVLSIFEEVLEPGDPAMGKLLNNLATAHKKLGEYDRAVEIYDRALAEKERAVGPDHPDLITTLNNLGNVLQDVGNTERARATFERALAIARTTLGPDHPQVGVVGHNYGIFLYQTGDLEGANAKFEEAIVLLEATHGKDTFPLAGPYEDIGIVRKDQGRLDEAADYLSRSLRVREAELGPDHPDTVSSRENYASVLKMLGRNAEADKLTAARSPG